MRHIALGVVIAAAILLPLFAFLDLIEQLDDVGQGDYRTQDAFYFVLLLLPRRLVQLLPFIALIGNVIALGRLAMHSEIISMRAAGLSPLRLSLAPLKVGLCLLALGVVLEQFIAPLLQQKAMASRSRALVQSAELGEDLGIWTRDERHILRIGKSVHSAYMQEIEIFIMDEAGLLSEYIYADNAEVVDDTLWYLNNVTKKELNGLKAKTRKLSQMQWRSSLAPEQIATLTKPPESLSPTDLYHYMRYLQKTGQQYDAISLALWRKLGAGFMMIAMLLLSVPFVFGAIRSGVTNRLVLAGITGIGVYLLDQIVSNVGLLLDLNYGLIALAPGFILIWIAAVWLQRIA